MTAQLNLWRKVGLGLALAVSLASGQSLDQIRRDAPRSLPLPNTVQAKSVFGGNNAKIDPSLQLLVSAVASKGIGDMDVTAKSLGLSVDNEDVAVSLYANSTGDVAVLRRSIEDRGGSVSAVVDNVVLAHVPLDSINTLGRQNALHYMAGQVVLQPTWQRNGLVPAVSEGVGISHVAKLHQAGITGKGVKIGIIDFGFQGYSAQQNAGHLPAPRNTALFNKVQKLENGEVHGAGCAEIIHQMAPDAALYLAVVDGEEGQIINAADWMVQQGVNIISFSGGSPLTRTDGKDTISMKVDEVSTRSGILWVIAAGNEADSHWMGTSQNTNADGSLKITADGGNVVALRALGTEFAVTVRWDDWGPNPKLPGSNQDLDAYLYSYDPASGKAELVSQSTNPQQGSGIPKEVVGAKSQPGQIFLLRIQAAHVTRSFKVHAFATGPVQISPLVKAGSIAVPGAAREAVTVGAVDALKGSLSSYSSQGPTDDNRIKPDVAASDNTTSEAYAGSGGRFPGTSAATPHAAGFAALLKQISPQAGMPQLREQVLKYVRPLGSPSPNNEYGHGQIDGERVPANGGMSDGGGTGGTNLVVRLPQGWGGSVSSAALDRVRSLRGDSMDVKVVVGKPVYQVGDGMKIGYRSSEDCYYLLLHRSMRGEYTLVAPTEDDPNRLSGGQRYALPQGQETIRVSLPTGMEEIILICSRQPIDLNHPESGKLSVSVAGYEVKQ